MRKIKTSLVFLLFLVLFSMLFMDKGVVDSSLRLLGPTLPHIFGCDSLGRDLFGRVCFGAVVSLFIGCLVSFASMLIASALALLSFRREKLRSIVMAVVGAFKSIPVILVGLLFATFFGGSILSVSLALIISNTCAQLRVLETKVKELEGEDYVLALDALGLKKRRVLFFHILPSLVPLLAEEWVSVMMGSIMSESALSFLGVGIDRSIPTLGAILSEGRSLFFTHPHLVVFPSLVLLLLGVLIMVVKSGVSELDSATH